MSPTKTPCQPVALAASDANLSRKLHQLGVAPHAIARHAHHLPGRPGDRQFDAAGTNNRADNSRSRRACPSSAASRRRIDFWPARFTFDRDMVIFDRFSRQRRPGTGRLCGSVGAATTGVGVCAGAVAVAGYSICAGGAVTTGVGFCSGALAAAVFSIAGGDVVTTGVDCFSTGLAAAGCSGCADGAVKTGVSSFAGVVVTTGVCSFAGGVTATGFSSGGGGVVTTGVGAEVGDFASDGFLSGGADGLAAAAGAGAGVVTAGATGLIGVVALVAAAAAGVAVVPGACLSVCATASAPPISGEQIRPAAMRTLIRHDVPV